MNVLHLDEQRGWRGGEQQASYLIRGLAQRGHTQFIAGRKGESFLERDHGAPDISKFALPFANEADIYTAWRLAGIVRKHDIDIIHAHTSHAHAMAVLTRKFADRGKVVVSRRVDFPPRANAFTRWKYRAADAVIAISDAIADVLRAYGVDNSRIHVVHSGIDPTRVDAVAIDRSVIHIPDDAPLFGNVAALVGHKDHATLMRAFRHVVDVLPEAWLVVAGEGKLRADIETLIRELNLGEHVQLLGQRDDVPSLLHALDVFVMSSKEEGLGTSVLDAMAARVPVVSTDGGGLPEMVQHEETGLIGPVGDEKQLAENMLRMWRDRALAARVVESAHELLLTKFTADAMTEGNLRVYERVIAG